MSDVIVAMLQEIDLEEWLPLPHVIKNALLLHYHG